ncbi:hypothetical protein RV15_GL003625 [Enterococcus silesiacus]|uniref:Uncharacterized protein n=1 Tax=Enterococcus silesiacus TaxID=332949 RepID=A0AA91GHX0_9ENTE|nr:hypothetical protein RV15_GL003625 [Enterococcus silesiacus]
MQLDQEKRNKPLNSDRKIENPVCDVLYHEQDLSFFRRVGLRSWIIGKAEQSALPS